MRRWLRTRADVRASTSPHADQLHAYASERDGVQSRVCDQRQRTLNHPFPSLCLLHATFSDSVSYSLCLFELYSAGSLTLTHCKNTSHSLLHATLTGRGQKLQQKRTSHDRANVKPKRRYATLDGRRAFEDAWITQLCNSEQTRTQSQIVRL